ncbi:MAG: Xaa-Pro aminopeptidase [Sinobacteraceae bacterium]|nr:Xaa-Pro aminopeptidase [Nevskiaceae bacterium]MCP5339444.1 Xaa-Pro aminopeptidase [Nevskiaceae bacterium]MCP5360557.1 Xaa-Pro aminopeptidase [Nevskiaceae bacterium]MCP5472904.1 Xaa-Pro aminopeptidase [Nevskiaceae bacterium]
MPRKRPAPPRRVANPPPAVPVRPISRDEFRRRRRQLMKTMGRDSIAILPAAPIRLRNNDVEYAYRQDSDFHYLTGFPEPEAVAVFVPGREQGEYLLFVRERDPERETWDGRRAGPEGATRDHAADDAFPINDIDEILPGLMENRAKVFYTVGVNREFDQRVVGWVNALRAQAKHGRHPPYEMVALEHFLHDMRLYKSRAEIELMREAARIAARAHVRAMHFARPGLNEYQVMAEITHEFAAARADISYLPIVGGGANGCILHYRENDCELKDGELLLIDAGCEFEKYASDITRTFPVNGRFSDAQRALYDVVLEANQAAIARVKPGNDWNAPHEAAVQVLTAGLVRLGLLKGRVSALIKSQAYRRFYMHRTGHWLGMDVHDVGDYKLGDQWRVLEPGMVLTIEPGLYIPPGAKGVPRRFQGIGIRIEDDVLVTKDGCSVLTADVPKDADEIEALMATA